MARGRYRRLLIDYLGLTAVLVLLIAIFGFSTDNFFRVATFRTIANQIPAVTIIAVGMTFVLIIAGIDLSVGSVLALGAMVLGAAVDHAGLSVLAAIPLALLTGALCGAINGVLTVRWVIPSFIVTLGMLEAARGSAHLISQQTIYLGGGLKFLAEGVLFRLSPAFFIAIALVVCGQITLSYTAFGRRLFAIGANEETARLSGIPTRFTRFLVFTLSGLFAGLAAVMHCARLSASDPNAGTGYELQAIAAVVIGGTSLMGGRGAVINSFFGVAIIAVLETGLVHLEAPDPLKRIVTGAVIVVAVVLDQYRHVLRRRRAAI